MEARVCSGHTSETTSRPSRLREGRSQGPEKTLSGSRWYIGRGEMLFILVSWGGRNAMRPVQDICAQRSTKRKTLWRYKGTRGSDWSLGAQQSPSGGAWGGVGGGQRKIIYFGVANVSGSSGSLP